MKSLEKSQKIILYPIRIIFIAVIKFYRFFISPLFPQRCRYYPSCSVYALQAIEKYGPIKGGGMALFRILRCNPFSKGGVDPVR